MNRKISISAAVLAVAVVALSGCAAPGLSGFGADQPKPQASIVTPGVVVQATPSQVTKSANNFSSQITGGLIPPGKVPGEDVIVQITGGPLLSIPQPGPSVFTPGERVEVIHSPATGRYRIVPLAGSAAATQHLPPLTQTHMTLRSPFHN